MDVFAPMFTLNILGLEIDGVIVIQWVVMLILIFVSILFVRKLNVDKPGKIQTCVEMAYEGIEGLVNGNMGSEFKEYVHFVGTLAIFLGTLNLLGIVGIEPPTKDLSVVIGFASVTFVLVHYNSIKRKGFKNYLTSFAKPFVLMLPINIMEKLIFPVSLTLRLFGNMLAASIVLALIYNGLGSIWAFAQIGLPIIPHAFFDLFDGVIQTVIFVMLTIITIRIESSEE